MTKTYEAMLLLDNREVKKGWEDCKSAVTGIFAKHSAKVVSARRWDETRLAYPINNQMRGTYLLVYFNSDGPVLPSISRDLEYSDAVLRHLTLVCDEVPPEAHEPEAEFNLDDVRVEEAKSVIPVAEPEPEQAEEGEAKAEDTASEGDSGEEAAKADGEEAAKPDGEEAPAASIEEASAEQPVSETSDEPKEAE